VGTLLLGLILFSPGLASDYRKVVEAGIEASQQKKSLQAAARMISVFYKGVY